MKRPFILVLAIISGISLMAQTAPKPKPKTATPVKAKPATPPKPVLKNLLDSASYAAGLSRTSGLKQLGISSVNASLIKKGCDDVAKNNQPLLDPSLMNGVFTRFVEQQKNKKPEQVKPAVAGKATSVKDSISYFIGFEISNFCRQYGVDSLNSSLVTKAITDVTGNKPTLISEAAIGEILNKFISQIHQEKAKVNIEAGNAFLAQNKLRPEVKTTSSGLQYEVITEGTGIRPAAVDTFVAHYRGTLIDGTEFDASYNRGQPLTLPVTSVIKGWTEGLQLMSVGSKYKFYIPYDLGYGVYGSGAIPGGAALIFEVELLDVKKKAN